ncbi:MAG: pilus assembly protein PilM [Candidatus Omnitrophica bacterium]|nr:pilus assembly protein PilM [Candidatus Omnitrophota bacterium]
MSLLGIYFGPKVISIAETKGRKLDKQVSISQATPVTGELEDKVPVQIKDIQIVALLKDETRKNRIEAKEASVCLSGKDLIIRTFEIPLLPREELQGAINFEVKKYIPFKVEELVWDFQIKSDKKSGSNLVFFMGIKKDILGKYLNILQQMSLKVNAIEYSAFSVLRCLKLAGVDTRGIVGVLEAQAQEEDEVNFSVLEDGFPLFNRDIGSTGLPQDPAASAQGQPQPEMEKLKSEVRLSLDYYQRKFPQKRMKNIFLICGQEQRQELEGLIAESGYSVKFIDTAKSLGKSLPYSLSMLKGYSVSLSKTIKTSLKVDLWAAQQRLKTQKAQSLALNTGSLLQGLAIDYRVIFLGLLICGATYGFGYYKMQPLQEEINNIVAKQVKLPFVLPGATYDELNSISSEYQVKLVKLDKIVKKQLYLTWPLEVIPKVIPEGVWLTSFTFVKELERPVLTLNGSAYLLDADKEFEAVNEFISALKNDPEFSGYFKEIGVVFLNRNTIERDSGNITMTDFSISCKSYQEGR